MKLGQEVKYHGSIYRIIEFGQGSTILIKNGMGGIKVVSKEQIELIIQKN